MRRVSVSAARKDLAMTAAASPPPPPAADQSTQTAVQPGRFELAGKPIVCSHCGNDTFVRAEATAALLQLQAGDGSKGVNARPAGALVCMDCTRVEWFLNAPRPRQSGRVEHGPAGVEAVGHRKYVGGRWEQLGRLQLEFLLDEGLRPEHVLLDIACGSLRAGVWLIPYLNAAHYLGIDKEPTLIDAALTHELPPAIRAVKRPRLLVDGDFAFEKFDARPDFALAQSLFSHLPPPAIERCFTNLRRVIADAGRFYATFFETDAPMNHGDGAHDHKQFAYTRDEMLGFGQRASWAGEYRGDWGHPRGQVMVRYEPA